MDKRVARLKFREGAALVIVEGEGGLERGLVKNHGINDILLIIMISYHSL